MKYLTILLLSFPIYSLDLDLTIPELPYDYEPIEIEERRFLNLSDYNEPPTKGQLIYFWSANVLDVWTTHRGMKSSPYVKELNPLLPERPELEELILHKLIVGGLIHRYGSKDYISFMNMSVTYAVWNNYDIIYND